MRERTRRGESDLTLPESRVPRFRLQRVVWIALPVIAFLAVLALLWPRPVPPPPAPSPEQPAPAGEPADGEASSGQEAWLPDAWYSDNMQPPNAPRFFPSEQPSGLTRCRYQLDYVSRDCLLFTETGAVERQVTPADGQRLVFAVGADYETEAYRWDSVEFRLIARPEEGPEQLLWRSAWLQDFPRHSGWTPVSADLSDYAGQSVQLVFQVDIQVEGHPGRPHPMFLVSEPRLTAAEPPGRPNIILWSIETTRRDHLSLYGYERPTTPFLEDLAREAIVFERAYAQCSCTKPSVSSILTGLYPCQHGAGPTLKRLPDPLVTVAEMLREHGYMTGAITTMYHIQPRFNFGQGFDQHNHTGPVCGDALNQTILRYLDVEAVRPFFLFVHSADPHGPYHAPGHFKEFFRTDYEGRLRRIRELNPADMRRGKLPIRTPQEAEYVVARYDSGLRYADSCLRRFVQGLKRRDLWQDTLLIITADHGEEFLEHGSWDHSKNLFVEKLMIPLIVKLPGGRLGGRRVGGLVSHVDLAPTILGAVDVDAPSDWPGIDFLSGVYAQGRSPRRRHYAEYLPGRGVVPERHYSLITDRHQYIGVYSGVPGTLQEQHLYDLVTDPLAQEDLADDGSEVLAEYSAHIRRRSGHRGYTLVANGGSAPRTCNGTVRTDGRFEAVEEEHIEQDDEVVLSENGKVLSFRLTVAGDDDVLRFWADPPDSAVTVALDPGSAEGWGLRIGANSEPVRLPYTAPGHRSALDVDFGDAVGYAVGADTGLIMWRQGVYGRHEAEEVIPDRETLRGLRDLGYL
ncbi:MAG: sulfatase [Candidatus Brocadiia bacterium]